MIIVQPDPERIVTDALAGLIAADLLPPGEWRRGRVVPAGVTPRYFLQVRAVAGSARHRVEAWRRVDVRVWADGTLATLTDLSRAGEVVLAWLQDALTVRVFMFPARMPDPADPTRVHLMMTVDVLTRGVQL